MSSAATWQARFAGMTRRAGGGLTATLRRRNTLASAATGAGLVALSVAGSALTGATSINLDAPSLRGELAAGSKLTIAGVTGTYAVAAPVDAAAGVLTGVTFAPALAGPAADNAAVAVTQSYGDYAGIPCYREDIVTKTEGGEEVATRTYVVAASDLPFAPRSSDLLIEGDTQTATGAEAIGPAGAAAWRFKVAS